MASKWAVKATGDTRPMIHDEEELRRAIELFADPQAGFELMALTAGKHYTGPGSDPDNLVRAAHDLPAGIGLYFRINPVPAGASKPATNAAIVSRRWLYIDVDPVKPDGLTDEPSTESEMWRTGQVCDSVVECLHGHGFPPPIVVASGNGFGLFYRIEMPNDALSQSKLRKILLYLDQFSGSDGKIDKSVHNANRLAKLPGTWARKGTDTPDRPHRPCRLMHVPESILVTPDAAIESVLAAAPAQTAQEAPKPTDPNPNPPAPYRPPAGQLGGKSAAYARAALEAECARVVMARPPSRGGDGRNNAVARAAFCLGQLVAGGLLSREVVVERLMRAAELNGVGQEEQRKTIDTITRCLDAGATHPRAAPESNDPRPVLGNGHVNRIAGDMARLNGRHDQAQYGTAPETPPEKRRPLTVKLSQVKPEKVEWLVQHRIPLGFITVVAGRTGVGKSFACLDMIARMSVGGEIPLSNGKRFERAGTLILSEDSPEYVLVPRLIDAGADLDLVHAMTWDGMSSYHLSNTDMLDEACNEIDHPVRIVMIDPPTNFIEGVDEHSNSEVRNLVMRVVEWALARKVAVLFILHVNKQSGKGLEAINRVMGSVAWVTTARIAHTICPDPETPGQTLMVPTKSNIGPMPPALAYKFAPVDPEDPESGARIEWVGEVDVTADEALGHAGPRVRRDVIAAEWLIERFREKLDWPSDELFAAATATGISRNAVFDARAKLELPKARKITHENGRAVWVWWVPADWPSLTPEPK